MQAKPKNPAQKKRKKRRTRAEKVGRLKYIIQRIGRLEQKIDGIDLRTRTMIAGLRDWMSFKSDYIEKVACQDEVDAEIIERLVQADDWGGYFAFCHCKGLIQLWAEALGRYA